MQHYDAIRHVLQRVRSRWRTLSVLQASMRGTLAASVVVAAALIAAREIGRAPMALVLVGALALLCIAAVVIWASLPLRHVPDDGRVARFIEERTPALDDRLASAVDVVRPDRQAVSPALIEPMLADAARRVTAIDLDTIVSRASMRRAGGLAGAAALLLLVLCVMARGPAGQAVDAASLALFPEHVTLEVTPGSATIKAGEPLTIRARLVGNRAPVTARVDVADGDRWKPIEMAAASGGGFGLALPPASSSFRYRVVAGARLSPTYEIKVAHAPRVTRIDVDYTYPAALALEPRTEEDGGDIYAPAGTDVRVRIQTDRPAKSGRMSLGDGKQIALAASSPTSLTASLKVTSDDSYRIALADAEGFANPGDTEYFIRMLEDRPPDVRILAPAADKSVTRLEEVDIEAQADDDYGIASLDLVYSVRGGPDTVVPIGAGRHATSVTGRHTLYLEDLDVHPGDFVSYYVRARDITRGSRSNEAKSDIFFLEVKPFEQEFRLAQSQSQAGGGGSSVDDLVTAQKEIVVATWKLDRRAQAAKGARPEQDIRAVSRAEGDLKTRVEQTSSSFRESTMRDPRRPQRGGGAGAPKAGQTMPEEDAMAAASAAMGKAVTSLDALNTGDAMPPEMQALNHLLKAQADVKRRDVSREQAGTGRGDNNRNYDMSSLFDKELQRQQQTNYETKSTAEQKNDSGSALDAIKDLARRQDELLKRQLELAKQRAQMSEEALKRELEKLTREQSDLRQQAEELARQMSTSSAGAGRKNEQAGKDGQTSKDGQTGKDGQPAKDGQSGQQAGPSGQSAQGSGGASGRQMRDVSEAMRNAASDLRRQNPDQASASGSRALEKLRDLEQQLQPAQPDARRRAVGEMQMEARQLAESQRSLASQTGKTPQGAGSSDAARRLSAEQERIADRTRKLQAGLKQQASAASPDAAGRKDQNAGGGAVDNSDKSARTAAGEAAQDLDAQHLADRMQKAADDMRAATSGRSGADPRAQAATQEELARALDRLADKLGAATGTRDAESKKLSEQLGRAQELRERMAETAKQVERLGTQSGKGSQQPSAQKSPGDAGRSGEGQQAGSGGSGSDLARLQQEYQRQLAQTRDLMDQLKRDDPNFAKSGAGFTFEGQGMVLSAPGTEAFKQDFAAWELLRQQATQALDKAESTLSQKLQRKESKDRLAAGVDDKPPAEYQTQVDSYFKALAKKK
jgi:hypothetical protein